MKHALVWLQWTASLFEGLLYCCTHKIRNGAWLTVAALTWSNKEKTHHLAVELWYTGRTKQESNERGKRAKLCITVTSSELIMKRAISMTERRNEARTFYQCRHSTQHSNCCWQSFLLVPYNVMCCTAYSLFKQLRRVSGLGQWILDTQAQEPATAILLSAEKTPNSWMFDRCNARIEAVTTSNPPRPETGNAFPWCTKSWWRHHQMANVEKYQHAMSGRNGHSQKVYMNVNQWSA